MFPHPRRWLASLVLALFWVATTPGWYSLSSAQAATTTRLLQAQQAMTPTVAPRLTSLNWSYTVAPPTKRHGLAAATGGNGLIYAIGGDEGFGDGPFQNTVEGYNVWTGAWITATSMPVGRGELAAATGPDGLIYTAGGFVGTGAVTNTLEIFDSTHNTWKAGANMPTAREGLAAAFGRDGRLYTFGGYNYTPGVLTTVEAYTPKTNTWTTLAPMPTPRNNMGAVLGPDGLIYVVGGYGQGYLATVEAYNPKTNTWTTMPNLKQVSNGLGVVLGADNQIYAFGGCCAGDHYTNAAEAYNVHTKTWTLIASMPTPRTELGAATGPDGRIYAISGMPDFSSGTDTGVTYVYGPSASVSPSSGAAGSSATVSGYYFAGSATVSVYWGKTTTKLLGTGVTSSYGNIATPIKLTIPTVYPGHYTITVVDSKSKYPTYVLFTVTP